jgi:hypothetical protein
VVDLIRGLESLARPRSQVGADEMIERVEARLTDDAVLVVTGRPGRGSRGGGSPFQGRLTPRQVGQTLIWATAGTAIVIGLVWMSAATGGDESPANDSVITTVPIRIDTSRMNASEIVETGIDVWQGGESAAVAQLFDLGFRSQWSSRDLEGELAYQRKSTDLWTPDCVADGNEVVCEIRSTTPMAAALGRSPSTESARFVVENATISPIDDRFPPPVWSEGGTSMAVFLRLHGRIIYAEPWDTQLKQYALECIGVPREEFCASLEEKNLAGWAAWYPGTPEEMVEVQVTAWFGGDCERAYLVVGELAPTADINCPDSAIQYETDIGATADVNGCSRVGDGDEVVLECEILYQNEMSRAVAKGPVSVVRSYEVGAWLTELDRNYPEDAQLMASFERYAQESDIEGEYETACRRRQPACADFILNRLDEWAAWHRDNF